MYFLPVSLIDFVFLEIRLAFALFDQDGDGAITYKELMAVMRSLGLSHSDQLVKQMIQSYDEDGG